MSFSVDATITYPLTYTIGSDLGFGCGGTPDWVEPLWKADSLGTIGVAGFHIGGRDCFSGSSGVSPFFFSGFVPGYQITTAPPAYDLLFNWAWPLFQVQDPGMFPSYCNDFVPFLESNAPPYPITSANVLLGAAPPLPCTFHDVTFDIYCTGSQSLDLQVFVMAPTPDADPDFGEGCPGIIYTPGTGLQLYDSAGVIGPTFPITPDTWITCKINIETGDIFVNNSLVLTYTPFIGQYFIPQPSESAGEPLDDGSVYISNMAMNVTLTNNIPGIADPCGAPPPTGPVWQGTNQQFQTRGRFSDSRQID